MWAGAVFNGPSQMPMEILMTLQALMNERSSE
jgi:hypothetical protein